MSHWLWQTIYKYIWFWFARRLVRRTTIMPFHSHRRQTRALPIPLARFSGFTSPEVKKSKSDSRLSHYAQKCIMKIIHPEGPLTRSSWSATPHATHHRALHSFCSTDLSQFPQVDSSFHPGDSGCTSRSVSSDLLSQEQLHERLAGSSKLPDKQISRRTMQ